MQKCLPPSFPSLSARCAFAQRRRAASLAWTERAESVRLRPLIMAARFFVVYRAPPRRLTSATDPSHSPLPPPSHEYRRPPPASPHPPPPPFSPVVAVGIGFLHLLEVARSARAEMAAVRVDKATNELLLGPDWTLNIDICDAVNSDHGYVVFSPSISFTICSSRTWDALF